MRNLVWIALFACACGKGKDKDRTGDNKAVDKAGAADVASLFGKAPALPAEIAAAKFGGSKADNKALTESGYLPSKTVKGASFDLAYVQPKTGGETLDKVNVQADQDLEPILTAAWGKPIKTAKESYWFGPELRAWLPAYAKGKTVSFMPYAPLDKTLGGKGFDLAFAKGKPLLGATMDQLHDAWGAALCNWDEKAPELKKAYDAAAKDSIASVRNIQREMWLCQPVRTVSTWDVSRDTVRFGLDGRVEAFGMEIPFAGSPELKQQILTMLDGKLGTPTELKKKDELERWYFDPANHAQAVARVSADMIYLEVMPLLPVAELVGGDKPGLSIEGAHMPGGTFDQIGKDDPDHFNKTGELASLVYPATEFNAWQTDVELQFNAHETNTYGYRLVIHFTDNEPQGDKIFELLKAKFGEPTVDAELTKGDDKYWSFAKNGRKVRARRVSQQWQLDVGK